MARVRRSWLTALLALCLLAGACSSEPSAVRVEGDSGDSGLDSPTTTSMAASSRAERLIGTTWIVTAINGDPVADHDASITFFGSAERPIASVDDRCGGAEVALSLSDGLVVRSSGALGSLCNGSWLELFGEGVEFEFELTDLLVLRAEGHEVVARHFESVSEVGPVPAPISRDEPVTAPSPALQQPDPVFPRMAGGCYATPAYEVEAVNMSSRPPAWTGLTTSPTFDLNGDGISDELYSLGSRSSPGFDGYVQAYLGDQLGWTDLLLDFTSVPYLIEGVADLDADGADEVLLSHQGNNFAGIVVVDLDGCDLRLARDPDVDAERLFLLNCSSNSCAGERTRLDCIDDPAGDRLREHMASVVPGQLDSYRRGELESPDWHYTIRDSRLVDGVMQVVSEQTTAGPNEGPLPQRWDDDHFVESCWD